MLKTIFYLFEELEKVDARIKSGEHEAISEFTEIHEKLEQVFQGIINNTHAKIWNDTATLYSAYEIVYKTSKKGGL